MAEGWHKCFLCDTLYLDLNEPGYWGYCPTCRPFVEAETQEEVDKLKGTQKPNT